MERKKKLENNFFLVFFYYYYHDNQITKIEEEMCTYFWIKV